MFLILWSLAVLIQGGYGRKHSENFEEKSSASLLRAPSNAVAHASARWLAVVQSVLRNGTKEHCHMTLVTHPLDPFSYLRCVYFIINH